VLANFTGAMSAVLVFIWLKKDKKASIWPSVQITPKARLVF
jgi:hypothetical protein